MSIPENFNSVSLLKTQVEYGFSVCDNEAREH